MANIKAYDESLRAHSCGFVPVKPEKQGIYQRYGSFGNQFIFLRNNIHIERLAPDDLLSLQTASSLGELEGLVRRTWAEAVAVRWADSPAAFDVIYDTGALTGFATAPNTSLVFGLSHDWAFDETGRLVSLDTEKAKEKAAKDLALKMQTELSKRLGVAVTVLILN
jgi:hypothetical protein